MTTEVFKTVKEKAAALGEANDCAVKAVTIATGLPYEQIHAMMKLKGRKDRKGTMSHITVRVLNELGYRVDKITMPINARRAAETSLAVGEFARARLKKYPKHYPVKNFTVKQLDTFKDAWSDLKNVLILTRGHILSFKDGQVHDWTQDRKNRILQVWVLEKVYP